MLFFFVFYFLFLVTLLLVRLGLRVSLLLAPLPHASLLHHLIEVLLDERPVLAGPPDVGNVVFVPAILLHQLRRRWGDLHLVRGLLRCCGRRGLGNESPDVLDHDLALRASAGHGFDVDPVVPGELLRTGGGVDLLLRGVSKALEILHRDLVVRSSALEPGRDGDTLGLREVFGRPAREARDSLFLGGHQELLGEVAPGRQEEESGLAVGRLVQDHVVDDQGESLRGGRHGFRVGLSGVAVYPLMWRGLKMYFFLQLQKK